MTSIRTIRCFLLHKHRWVRVTKKQILNTATKYINHGLAEIKDDHLVLTENGKFGDGIAAELFFTNQKALI